MAPVLKALFIFYVGLGVPFMDMDQFDEDLDTFGLDPFNFPIHGEVGAGFHLYKNNHAFRFTGMASGLDLESHKKGRYSYFSEGSGTLKFGYGYNAVEWMDTYTDVGIGWSQWQYLLITPSFDGHARGMYWHLLPETGLQFNFSRSDILKPSLVAYVRYHLNLADGRQLYSGDWTRDHFDELNMNYLSVGMYYMIRF